MNALEVFSSFEKAVELTKETNSGCISASTERHIALSPKYIGRLRTGVGEILDAELGRFSESLRGVLLAYGNVKLLQSAGAIVDDSPFIHFDVKLDAVVFRPKIGSLLKCVVNEQAYDHVGCLVHDWFNVSLLASRKELNDQRQLKLEPGCLVLVQVERLRAMNGMLAIEARAPDDGSDLILKAVSKDTDSESNVDSILQASLSDTPDGPSRSTLTAGMEASNEKTKKKKCSKVKREADVDSNQRSSCPEESGSASQSGIETAGQKKSKKLKQMETPPVSTGEETTREKKKKKRHGNLEVKVDPNPKSIVHSSDNEFTQILTGEETSHEKKKQKKKKHVNLEVEVDPNPKPIVNSANNEFTQIMTGEETSHEKKKQKKKKHVKLEVDPNPKSIVHSSDNEFTQIMTGEESSHEKKKKKKHAKLEDDPNPESIPHESDKEYMQAMTGEETSNKKKKKKKKNWEARAGVDSLQPPFTPSGPITETEEEIPKGKTRKRQSDVVSDNQPPPSLPDKEFTKLKKKKRRDQENDASMDSSQQPLFSDLPSSPTEGTVHKKAKKQKRIKQDSFDGECRTPDTNFEYQGPGAKTESGTEPRNVRQSVLTPGSHTEVSRKSHKKHKRKAVDGGESDEAATNGRGKKSKKKKKKTEV